MSLKETIKQKTTSTGVSDRGPKFYNQQKNLFIDEMSRSPEEVTRIQVAANDHVPTGILRRMIETEENEDVLRTLLLNPRTPIKAIEKFSETDLAEQFNDDEEVAEHLRNRTGNDSEDSDDGSDDGE